MKITIKETLIELPLGLRRKIEKRMKSLEKFLKHWEKEEELSLSLEVGRENMHHQKGDIYRVEVNLLLHSPHEYLRAECVSDNLITATKETYQELKRQIRKYKIGRECGIRKGARKLKKLLIGK